MTFIIGYVSPSFFTIFKLIFFQTRMETLQKLYEISYSKWKKEGKQS